MHKNIEEFVTPLIKQNFVLFKENSLIPIFFVWDINYFTYEKTGIFFPPISFYLYIYYSFINYVSYQILIAFKNKLNSYNNFKAVTKIKIEKKKERYP